MSTTDARDREIAQLREILTEFDEVDEHRKLAAIADQIDCAIATDKVKVTIEERDEWKRKAEAYRKLIGENSKAVQYNKDIAYDLGERLKDMQELNVQITAERDRLSAENKRLREALEWYGQIVHEFTRLRETAKFKLQHDGGDRARAALEGKE